MADLRAALGRVAELETLAVVLDSENRAQAAEIRRLRVLVGIADRWAAQGDLLARAADRSTGPAEAGLRKIARWDAVIHRDLGARLAAARHWIDGQGPDGPRAAYRLDPATLRRGPAEPPLAAEAAETTGTGGA